jgi:hypothetical protein
MTVFATPLAQRDQVRVVEFLRRGQVERVDVVNLKGLPAAAPLALGFTQQVEPADQSPTAGPRRLAARIQHQFPTAV